MMEWTQLFEAGARKHGTMFDRQNMTYREELGAILDTFVDLVEWLEEWYGSAKEKAKQHTEKFKQKLDDFKKLNGGPVPQPADKPYGKDRH